MITSIRLVAYNDDVIRYASNPRYIAERFVNLLEYVLGAIQPECQPHEFMSSVRCVECCVVGTFFVQLKGALYRIWCGLNGYWCESGVNSLGDISAFVTPAGQLLLPGGVRPECIPSALYLNSIQCPFNVPVSTSGVEDGEKLCPIELFEYIFEHQCVVWSFFCFIEILWV